MKKIDLFFNIYGTYELVDGFYNVDGHVKLKSPMDLIIVDKLPIKFGKVTGDFLCNSNYLKTLEGCPSYVGCNFRCDNNKLESLKGCPSYVGGDFWCSGNEYNLKNTKEYRQYEILKKLRK